MSKADPQTMSLEQVRHVAKLARLRLSESQLQQYQTQLSTVLEHIAKLQELDVDGVEPMAHPTDLTNRLDDDEPATPLPLEDVLRNAPAVQDRFVAVPKVLEE